MRRPTTIHSLAFRKAAMGVHDYGGFPENVLELKRKFEKRCWEEQIPVYCTLMEPGALCYALYPDTAMFPADWLVLAELVRWIARDLKLPVDIENVGEIQC